MRAPVQEVEARREEARQRRKALIEEVAAWRRAGEIRAYVDAVRAETEKRGEAVSEEFGEWERWALGVAGQVDPMGGRACSGGSDFC